MEVKKVCINCGKTFVTEDRHKICCSYKCRSAYEQMMKRLNGLPTRHSVSEAVKGFANKKLLSPSQAAKEYTFIKFDAVIKRKGMFGEFAPYDFEGRG